MFVIHMSVGEILVLSIFAFLLFLCGGVVLLLWLAEKLKKIRTRLNKLVRR